MDKYRTAYILIDIYNSSNSGRELHEKLYRELFTSVAEIAVKAFNAQSPEDLAGDVVLEILNLCGRQNSSVLNECRDKSELCGKRVTAYLFQIIKSKLSKSIDTLIVRESLRLREVLTAVIDELVSEGLLRRTNSNAIQRNTHEDFKLFAASARNIMENIRNSDGSISKQRLKLLTISLFDSHLENFAISFSNLKSLISEITSVGRQSKIYFEPTDDDDETPGFQITDENVFNDPEFNAESERLCGIWEERLKNTLKEEELELIIKLAVLKYGFGFTLTKLGNIFSMPKSTIDNRIKKFFAAVKLHKEVDKEDLRLVNYWESFLIYIYNRYELNLDHYLI